MENFFQANFEYYNTGRAPQKALKNVLHFGSQGPVIQVFLRQRVVRQMMYS